MSIRPFTLPVPALRTPLSATGARDTFVRRSAQVVRYAGVSIISTLTSLTILATLVGTGTLSAGWANVAATAFGTVPSFELNRRWVWRTDGRRSIRRQVIPFTALSFAGLVLSTIAVHVSGRWASGLGWSDGAQALVAAISNVSAFGVLWVAQFVILDRALFGPKRSGTRWR